MPKQVDLTSRYSPSCKGPNPIIDRYDVIPSTIYYYRISAVDDKGHYSPISILVSGRTNADVTPLRIKVDLEEKKKLNKIELERQITRNDKDAQVLKTRLKKII